MQEILTIRASSGLSGDMLLAGLGSMADVDQAEMDAMTAALGVGDLAGLVRLEPRSVRQVAGVGCVVDLPHEHAHRDLTEIVELLRHSTMPDAPRELAIQTFELLARAEGAVHGMEPSTVRFHEVGALDSIVDIGVACQLLVKLNPSRIVCSPLPLADGGVECAHGWLPTPAPAVMSLLEGVPVCAFAGKGETVTPTAIALLKAFGAAFGPWPSMILRRQVLAYGTKVFECAPNGAIFAVGPEQATGSGQPSGHCHGGHGHHHNHHHHGAHHHESQE